MISCAPLPWAEPSSAPPASSVISHN
jgi:hypothetical protein